MHHALTDKPTYWRSGVVLSIDGCKVLVRGDTRANVVRISVDGPAETRRSALAAVRDQFKGIHATIPKLKVEERVPLPDFPDVAVPHAYLLQLEMRSRTKSTADAFIPLGLPANDVREYSARQLLSGIDGSLVRAEPVAAPPVLVEPEAEAPARRPEPHKVEAGHLLKLVLLFLVLLGGISAAVIAELYFLAGGLAVLAATLTVLLAVVGFAFIALLTGLLEGSAAERLLTRVLGRVPVLGQARGSGARPAAGSLDAAPETGAWKKLPAGARKREAASNAPQLETKRDAKPRSREPAKVVEPKKRRKPTETDA